MLSGHAIVQVKHTNAVGCENTKPVREQRSYNPLGDADHVDAAVKARADHMPESRLSTSDRSSGITINECPDTTSDVII